jgi:pimeloyl-ACP methyl ester carboxylesterase
MTTIGPTSNPTRNGRHGGVSGSPGFVLWGKYDPSFDLSEPESYRRDVLKAEVHVLDAGHFALDTAADQMAELVRGFMNK